MNIIGSKKGQGKQRQPIIAPDSAQSKSYLNMLFGLGEGEILGLANGYKSVYLDGTPLQNDNGEFNFPSVKVDFRTGTNDQEYIDGFPDVASETNVGVELKHGTPWVKLFNNLDLDAVRVRLKWGALRTQNAESGDVSGVKIEYAIDLKTDNGGWVEMLNTTINAKTSDAYERSHRIDLPPATTGWQVRVRRLTLNSTSDYVSDKMFVSAITEVIDLKLRYPNTALLGLRCDATSFNNVPKMSVRCKGLIIKVPTNYDPVTRTYTGLWNGEFKLAYSNNPAWVYYDLCTNARYGLGNRLTPAMIDKWSLYRLAQYCDEMVDDGMGGQEPRFTVNVYIQSADGAFELLSKLAGVFRAISYWDGNSIVVDADIPQDSIYSFSRTNVIDGEFLYTGTRARDRHTVAKVAWDNPNNHFKTEYEFVRDEKAIAKFGVRVADISAWGCTSKGQAQRAGLWALKSEQLETRMVTFKVGLDGFIPAPAKVIEISDELFAGRANGGRVVAINKNKTVITLDRPITAKANDTLVINGDDGFSQRRLIKSINGDKITVTKAFGDISVENVWVLDSQDLATMKFRVLSVTADDNHTFTITAVQYNPAKYDAIDTGAYIDERPISVINPTVQAPTKSVNLSSYHTVNQGVSVTTLVIGWEQVTGAVKYSVEWRKDNGNWQTLPPTGTNSIEIAGVYAGAYEAKVTAISAFGQASPATHSNLTEIQGKIGKPTKLAKLTVQGVLFGMNLAWGFGAKSDDTNFTEIQVSPDGQSNITTLGTFAYPTNKHEITGLQGGLTQFYRGRIVDKLGNASDWTAWVRGTTDASADKVLEILSGQINESHLDQMLRTPIAKIGTLESAVRAVNSNLSTLNSQLATAQNELNTAKSTLQTAVGNITTERNRITTAIHDISALQTANNAKTQEIANLTNMVGGHTSSIRELGITTGDLSQKYSQLKTATDTANSEITAIKQTQNGQATSINRLNSEIANKATTSSLEALRQTSTDAHNANVRAINALSSTMQSGLSSKLDASAIQNYYTKAQADEKIQQVTTGKIEEFNANLTIGGVNILPNSHIEKTGASEHLYYAILPELKEFYLNNPTVTISFDIKVPVTGRVQVYTSNNSGVVFYSYVDINEPNKWVRYSVTVNPKPHPSNPNINQATLEFYGTYNTGRIPTVKNVKIESGNKATAWTPALSDVDSKINANAQAINTINSNVSNLNNTITSQGQAITQLNNNLTAINANISQKADSTALTALDNRVSNIDGRVSSQANQITTLQSGLNTANQNIATKLDSSAIVNYYTKAETDNVTAGKIDEFKSSLVIGGHNLWSVVDLPVTNEAGLGTKTVIKADDEHYRITLNQFASGRTLQRFDNCLVDKTHDFSIGDDYTFSFEIRANKTAKLDILYVYFGALRTLIKYDAFQLTENWQRIEINLKANGTNKTSTSQLFGINLYENSGWAIDGWYEVRYVQMQRGTKATAYNKASAIVRNRINANAQAINAINSDVSNINNTLVSQTSQISSLTANVTTAQNTANTASGKADTATTKADTAQSTANNALNRANSANSAITAEQRARADADTALGQRITAIDTAYKSADNATNAKLANAEKAISDNNMALSQRITALDSAYKKSDTDLTARLAREETARANGDTATTQKLSQLESGLNGKASSVALEQLNTKVNQVDGRLTAEANKVNQLQTTLNGQTASIRNVEQSINGVRAIKAVTVDNNGFISGYGLMSELQNGRVTSRFGVNADQIYFGATTSAKKPFIFATTPTTIDGVSYPAGAWFNAAHIARASINMLHIADSIQSDNYVAGRSGWRLYKNGELEINSSFGDGTRIQLNSRGLTGWYGNGIVAFELGIQTIT